MKLVLEPIFEADFKPCSYGFRPRRRAQDAIAEIHYLGTPCRNYEWVFEADITACFMRLSLCPSGTDAASSRREAHLGLAKAFLQAGILSEDGLDRTRSPALRKAGFSHL